MKTRITASAFAILSLFIIHYTFFISRAAAQQPSLDVFTNGSGACAVATFKAGERIFANRDYTLEKPPAAFEGMPFLRAPVEGMTIHCTAPGEILILSSITTFSLEKSLVANGFTKDTHTSVFQLFGDKKVDRVQLFRKTLKAGETLMLGKWGVVLGASNVNFKRATPATPDEAVAKRTWQGIPGLERTAKGRLFLTWFTGDTKEPAPDNMVLLCYSDDNGKTHSPLQVLGAPEAGGSRAFDPVPWIDPKGRLWYFFNRANKTTGQYCVVARICDNPDAPNPVFGPEFRIGFDEPMSFRMNKPTVLSSGEWILPVTYAKKPVFAWSSKDNHLQGVGISTDEGKTWKLHGAVVAPPWALESMIIELKDSRLWMLVRTGAGHLWESFSSDKGVTWSKGERSKIESPGSRFFIRRLSSGNLLLVNHFNFERDNKGKGRRTHLTAQISTDDGKTWNTGLLLDERRVSYPDGVEDKDGFIWITYDRERRGSGEILMAKFYELDALKGKNVSGSVILQHVLNRLPPKPPAKKK